MQTYASVGDPENHVVTVLHLYYCDRRRHNEKSRSTTKQRTAQLSIHIISPEIVEYIQNSLRDCLIILKFILIKNKIKQIINKTVQTKV